MRGTGRELPALGLTAPSPQPPAASGGSSLPSGTPLTPGCLLPGSYGAGQTDTGTERRTDRGTGAQAASGPRPRPPRSLTTATGGEDAAPAPRPPPAPLGRDDLGSLAPNLESRSLKPSPGSSPALPAAAARAWAATMSRSSAAETRTRSRPSAIFPRARPAAETGREGGGGTAAARGQKG